MKSEHRRGGLHCVLFAALIGVTSATSAQEYPAKPVRCIVPFTAGGGTDTLARLVGTKVSQSVGQPFVVENRAGADGRVGTELAAKAPPDGYTILLVSNLHAISSSVFAKLPYDPAKDFVGITLGATSPSVLVVHPSVPARSVAELVKLAKSRPGKLTYGTSGLAQTGHVSGELFKTMAGIDLLHVPYKGTADAMRAVLGGHVDMAFGSLAASLAHFKAGALRPLAITSATRADLAPDVRTMEELGFRGFVAVTWYGFLAPAGTPRPIVNKLNAEIVAALKMPDVRDRLVKGGLDPSPTGAEEFDSFIRAEIARFSKVVKAAAIRLE